MYVSMYSLTVIVPLVGLQNKTQNIHIFFAFCIDVTPNGGTNHCLFFDTQCDYKNQEFDFFCLPVTHEGSERLRRTLIYEKYIFIFFLSSIIRKETVI